MATVTSLVVPGEERYQINLGGTRAVFDYARAYGVEHCVFVGRHTFYGAGPDSPLFHTEDEPPMELNRFPELADLVASDLYAATALWRFAADGNNRAARLLHARALAATARSLGFCAASACR